MSCNSRTLDKSKWLVYGKETRDHELGGSTKYIETFRQLEIWCGNRVFRSRLFEHLLGSGSANFR